MPVTAVKTGWSSGDLVFKKKSDNSVLMSIKASTGDINIPTGVTLTVTDGITGLSLDAAYNAGRTLTVDAGAVILAGAQATANTLQITEASGSGNLIDLTQSGTGKDIDGTSSTWYVSKAGAATFATIASGAVTLSAGLDMSASGTGTYDFTLKNSVADALSIKTSAADYIVFDTSTPKITITPATTVSGLLTASAALTVTTGALTVSAGGGSITGGLTVVTGGLTVSAGTTSAITSTNIGLTGIVTVTGATSIVGNVDITGSLTWTGATTIGESVTVDELILDTDGTTLGNTVCGLWRDNAGDASLQAVAGKEVKFLIANTCEMEVGDSATIINEGSADRNFRVESNNLQYALYVDGGKDCVVIGDDTDKSDIDVRLWVGNVAKTLVAGEEAAILWVAPTASTTEAGSGTHDFIATAYFKEPNITGAGGDTTVGATVYIADAPTEATANHALYVAAGSTSLQGALTVTGATVLDGGAFTFNDTSADLDFRVESNNCQYALYVDGGKDSVVIGDNTDKSDVDVRLWVGNVAKTLLDNESAAIMVVAPTAATAESGTGATTHAYIATAYFAEPSITHAGTSTITTAATVYINDAPTEGASNAALYIASGALIMASGSLTLTSGNITVTSGNFTFSAASDLIVPAATAAALEISDATTKYYAIDTRVATAGVTSHTFNISAYTIASGAGNVETGWSFAAHTLNYTGATQVTTQVDTIVLGARTIAGDTATLTVDEANTLLAVAPTEGANVAITAASAIRVINAGGTPVSQYGLYIEDLTVGATNDVGIYIAGSDTAAIYVAADPVRLADSVTLGFGTGTGLGAPDATITYNGSNVVINPKVIGTGVIALGSGEGGTTAGSGTTLRAIDVIAGGAGNVNGSDLTIAAGLGTGTGTRGTVIIQTPQVAAAGDNIQTLETLATFGEDSITFKAGTILQSAAAGEIAFSVTNDALTIGSEGSMVIPYRSSTDANFTDTEGGNVDGCIGLQRDSDAGPTLTLEARMSGAWVSVALSGIEIQGKTAGGSRKKGELWHDNQLLGNDQVDETICVKCGKKMKVGDEIVLVANYERNKQGAKSLHAVFGHKDCP